MRILTAVIAWTVLPCALTAETPASSPAANVVDAATVPETGRKPTSTTGAPETRTYRFSAKAIRMMVEERPELFPLVDEERDLLLGALDAINFEALAQRLQPHLTQQFPDKWDAQLDLIGAPVEETSQITMDPVTPGSPPFRGPKREVVGFLVHDLSTQEYGALAIRVMQVARQMMDTGDPHLDRTSTDYYRLLAEKEYQQLQQQHQKTIADAERREYIRRHVGELLGVYDRKTGVFDGAPDWVKETRRFSYVVKNGEFIDKLRPLVDRINEDMEIAGFAPPSSLDHAGIYFDPDLGDVEVVLPRPMIEEFLTDADRLERRMAENQLISIEAVRLSDRDLLRGNLGARLNASFDAVHDVETGRDRQQALSEYGVNSLVAVANRQLEVANLRGIESGRLPAGAPPLVIPGLSLPLTTDTALGTTVGNTLSVGSDPAFFENGPIQRYGFSYVGPDGLVHTVSLDVADELTEIWSRIERNLVAHKIRRTEELTHFTVPVGPQEKVYPGLAAIITQENEERVIVSENTLAKIEATGGSWLVIRNFAVEPIPGSATTLTHEERRVARIRVLLTMFLRDPRIDVAKKERLLEVDNLDQLEQELEDLYAERHDQAILTVGRFRTYEDIFEERNYEVLTEAEVEKRERNTRIQLSFFSSQGAINRFENIDALGDINDLTSFTTELEPNIVTPISTSITATNDSGEGTSALTGIKRGQLELQEKQMTHLLLRVRYPSLLRERGDREEGRYTGYFELPISRKPHSTVDVPLLSSSDHPLDRLARLRPGLMFASLQPERVRKPFRLMTIEPLLGSVNQSTYNACMSRILLMQKLIADSPANTASYAPEYKMRFVVEVRSQLEFDEDFFNVANVALRNMDHWNDPARIALALSHSNDRFALNRLIKMIDELGADLLPDDYVREFVALSPEKAFEGHRLYPLNDEEIKILRRDVGNHYMRFLQIYGDAFMEAVSIIMNLGSYRPTDDGNPKPGPFRNFQELVLFDRGPIAMAQPEGFKAAHEDFLYLLSGGHVGRLFEPSFVSIEDLPPEHARFIVRGHHILEIAEELSKMPGDPNY